MNSKKKNIIVTNLYGKVLLNGVNREEAYKFMFETDKYNARMDRENVLRYNITNNKYITFKHGELDRFFEKLKNVILIVFGNKKVILGAFPSIKEVCVSGFTKKLGRSTIAKYLKTENLYKKANVYFLTGQSAVDILKKLGYLDEVINLNNKKEEN